MSQLLEDPLRRAHEALDRHDWAEAHRCLSEADTTRELDAGALELLAQAAYLAGTSTRPLPPGNGPMEHTPGRVPGSRLRPQLSNPPCVSLRRLSRSQ